MKYRNLEIGEVIQEGDEVLQDDEWQNVSLSIGDEVFIRYVFRRPLAPEQVANLFREKLADLMEEFNAELCISVPSFRSTTRSLRVMINDREYPLFNSFLEQWFDWKSITSPETGATE